MKYGQSKYGRTKYSEEEKMAIKIRNRKQLWIEIVIAVVVLTIVLVIISYIAPAKKESSIEPILTIGEETTKEAKVEKKAGLPVVSTKKIVK